MGCNYCNADIYIKTILYAKPLLTPATEVEALRQKIQEKTGEVYVMIPKRYCPMCGEELKGGAE